MNSRIDINLLSNIDLASDGKSSIYNGNIIHTSIVM